MYRIYSTWTADLILIQGLVLAWWHKIIANTKKEQHQKRGEGEIEKKKEKKNLLSQCPYNNSKTRNHLHCGDQPL